MPPRHGEGEAFLPHFEPMATQITINKAVEDLRWPALCCCCGGVDETDVETVVPHTAAGDRELTDVMIAEVPYCLTCQAHGRTGLSALHIGALALALCFVAPFVASAVWRVSFTSFIAVGFLLLAALWAWDRWRVRSRMTPGCASVNRPVQFTHPCSLDVTTLILANEPFARAFRRLNASGAYED